MHRSFTNVRKLPRTHTLVMMEETSMSHFNRWSDLRNERVHNERKGLDIYSKFGSKLAMSIQGDGNFYYRSLWDNGWFLSSVQVEFDISGNLSVKSQEFRHPSLFAFLLLLSMNLMSWGFRVHEVLLHSFKNINKLCFTPCGTSCCEKDHLPWCDGDSVIWN